MPPLVDPRPLRWLIAAPLSASPSGRRITVSGERFTTVMGSFSPAATVSVPDRVGSDDTRSLAMEFGRPRDFRVRDVMGKVELLGSLSAIVDRLAKDGDTARALQQIRTAIGDGRWVDMIEGRPPTPPVIRAAASTSTQPPAAATDGDDDDDPIFGKAALAPEPERTAAEAKSAVGSFISAMRSGDSPVPAPTSGRECGKLLRASLQETAGDFLAAAPVARLESAWRSLRMIMAACPSADDLGVDALDTEPSAMLQALAPALDADAWDRPDAVFVAEPVGDPELLGALADLADAARVPIVVQVRHETVGLAPDAQDVTEEIPEAWTALRDRASAGWLCAVVGAPVVFHEDDGGPRTVFGGGAAAIAAMAATSVGGTGTPAGILGKNGALVAPAAHDVKQPGGSHTIPTEHFLAYRTQQALGSRGVTALGSESDSDRLRLAGAPMVGGDMALPGRILAGRAHRLAVAVRQQLGPGATQSELERALDEASGAFLPKVGSQAVNLRVRGMDKDGAQVDASIGAALAGSSVSFSSDV